MVGAAWARRVAGTPDGTAPSRWQDADGTGMDASPTRSLQTLLRGRWQIPLALTALAAAGLTLHRLRPPPPKLDFDAALADLGALRDAKAFLPAADGAANLLNIQPPLPRAARAQLHDFIADVIYRHETGGGPKDPENLHKLIEHLEALPGLDAPLDATRLLRIAEAHTWLDQADAAIEVYRKARQGPMTADQRRAAAQALVELLAGKASGRAERRQLLEELLADERVGPAYAWWALRESIREVLREGDVAAARRLLDSFGAALSSADLKGYFEFLDGQVLLAEGRPDEAAARVGWVNAWLHHGARRDDAMARGGDVAALNAWLGGLVHLNLQQPDEAIKLFEEAALRAPRDELFIDASVGRARALAALHRDEEALQALEDVVARVQRHPVLRPRGQEAVRTTALALAEMEGRPANDLAPLQYLELVVDRTPFENPGEQSRLLERLAQGFEQAAARESSPEIQVHYRASAARRYYAAADLAVLEEPRLGDLLWHSAQAAMQAARHTDAQRALARFLSGRDFDARRPVALLQLGEACDSLGEREQALRHYRTVIDAYPRVEEATRARLLAANVLRDMGDAHRPEAERLLIELIDDERVSPDSLNYRDALRSLCELTYEAGRYADAISRLETFAELYPGDPEIARTRFLLADSHRRSALALRDHPPRNVAIEAAQAEALARFRRAAELYDAQLSSTNGRDDALQALYERLALLYSADCLFEINTPESLHQALDLYRRAAARYEQEPTALTAQVQIANICLRSGDRTAAARALERARWLLRGMPAQAFSEARDGADRASWDRYLKTVLASHQFRDVFSTPVLASPRGAP